MVFSLFASTVHPIPLPKLHLTKLQHWALSALTVTALGGAIATLPQTGFTRPAQAQTTCPLLNMGAQGNGVKTLQDQLVRLGYLDAHLATSYYGQPTIEAVYRLQAARGLFQDGVAGPQTLAQLGLCGQGGDSPTAPINGLSYGDVQTLQSRLVALGYDTGGIDGIPGAMTGDALEAFQRTYQYPPNRQVNRVTLDQVNTSFNRVCGDQVMQVALPDPSAGRVPLGSAGIPTCITYVPNSVPSQFPATLPPQPGFTPPSSAIPTLNPYLIAIPGDGWSLITKVRQFVPDAFQTKDPRRGPYIQAGAFPNRGIAEEWERYLRDQGLDARVLYKD